MNSAWIAVTVNVKCSPNFDMLSAVCNISDIHQPVPAMLCYMVHQWMLLSVHW